MSQSLKIPSFLGKDVYCKGMVGGTSCDYRCDRLIAIPVYKFRNLEMKKGQL